MRNNTVISISHLKTEPHTITHDSFNVTSINGVGNILFRNSPHLFTQAVSLKNFQSDLVAKLRVTKEGIYMSLISATHLPTVRTS